MLHLLELCGGRLLVVISQHHAANLRGSDITCEVDAHALLLKPGEVLAQGAPVGNDVVMVVGGTIGLNDGIVERSGGSALAGDLGRDALINFRRQPGINEDSQVRLAEHVDESRRDYHAVSVNGALARSCGEIADGGNFAIADTDVPGIPGRAGAVDDVAVDDYEIE